MKLARIKAGVPQMLARVIGFFVNGKLGEKERLDLALGFAKLGA